MLRSLVEVAAGHSVASGWLHWRQSYHKWVSFNFINGKKNIKKIIIDLFLSQVYLFIFLLFDKIFVKRFLSPLHIGELMDTKCKMGHCDPPWHTRSFFLKKDTSQKKTTFSTFLFLICAHSVFLISLKGPLYNICIYSDKHLNAPFKPFW